jgi:hypothetical protein
MIEDDLLLGFHREHFQRLVENAILAMKAAAPSGRFDGVARCATLWEEAVWGLQKTEDEAAQEAVRAAVADIGWGLLRGVLDSQLRIHAYYLGDHEDQGGMPLPEKESLVSVIVTQVCGAAAQRRMDDVERI